MSDTPTVAVHDPPRLAPLEGCVMHELWRRGESTVSNVLAALNESADRPRAYTTVLTVMQRLDRKGLLTRQRRGRADVYTAALSAEEYRNARAESDVAALIKRYGDAPLIAFVRAVDSDGR